MARETHADLGQSAFSLNLMSPEFMATVKQRFEELAEIQTELLKRLQQSNESWLVSMRKKASLASELGASLTAARSLPEIATACREWANRRVEIASEDATHLLADTQSFMETGARLRSDGWASNGGGGKPEVNDGK